MREDQEQIRTFTRRTVLLLGGQALLLSAVVGRMYQLQVDDAEKYATAAEENRINTRLLLPPRGRIFDRRGLPIAVNEEDYRVVIVAERTKDVRGSLQRLSEIIQIPPEDQARVLKEVRRRRRFLPVTIAQGLTWEEVARIEINAPDLPGILTERGLKRIYPQSELMAHLVGYVGPVNEAEQQADLDPLLRIPEFRIGKGGLERKYDEQLRGTSGTRRVEINASGRVQRELHRKEGTPGRDLHLTLDLQLQRFCMEKISRHYAASAVVLDVFSGEVLAMVSTPTYDPNLFIKGIDIGTWNALRKNKLGPMNNKAIGGQYAPGSTFKMVVALAGLEAGLITPESTFNCTGALTLGPAKFHCWRRTGHGVVDVRRSIKESCDIFFYELALKLGIDRIAEMAHKLGLGQETGVDIPGETGGLIPDKAWKQKTYKKRWYPGETVISGIGQGYVLATPMQLAVMVARLTNGGYAVKPRVVAGLSTPNTAPVTVGDTDFPHLGVRRSNLTLIIDAMNAVVNERGGTALASQIKNEKWQMGGKTGTSQVRRITKAERARGVVRNEDLPWERRDHALFVGFAPVERPRFATAVVVEHGGGGSTAAAPIAKEIMEEVQRRFTPGSDRATAPGDETRTSGKPRR
ncbi:MAG: penicillin-binding protein 2 [Bauldia litoralis]